MQGNSGDINTQPVRVLEHNILEWFEGKYPEFRQKLEELEIQYGMVGAIKYYCEETPILDNPNDQKTPYVSFNGQIGIHETFLSYVWGLSYAFLVIFDEQIHGPKTGNQPSHGKPIGYFLTRGYDVLNHSLGLIYEFKKWPVDQLPNPVKFDEEDRLFVERTNSIFLAAIDFILCHELAHIACGHIRRHKEAQSKGEYITSKEIKEFENEADQWALTQVVKGIQPPGRNQTIVGFGAIVGLGAFLFLNRNLTSRTHPDKNDRIGNVLSGLSIGELDNLWGIAATFYIAWNHAFCVGLDIAKIYDSYKELVQAIDDQLKPKKLVEENRRLGLD